MHHFQRIRAITLPLLTACLIVGSATAQDLATFQYGHSGNWNNAFKFPESSQSFSLSVADVGQGRAQIVGDGKLLYVVAGSSTRDKESEVTSVNTTITAYTTHKGELEQQWTYGIESTLRGDQQTFGGAEATPQSTPLVVGSKLIAMSFTGQLICLDCRNGEQLWLKDLVEEYGAVPVQFGFSSSPIVDSLEEERVVVLAAGEKGGLLNLNAADGSLNWRSDCTTFSYATPTSANFSGVAQWVIVSEEHVLGIRKSDGKRLWSYELPESGLTNVPSPLIIDDSRLLIAGQGCNGTRCLQISFKEAKWQVDELWHQARADFFYTNWMMLDEQTAIGSTDNYLAAIDVTTGELVGRLRGFSDGNLLVVDGRILLLDGRGKLTVFERLDSPEAAGVQTDGLTANLQVKLPAGRYWTPPSLIAGQLLIRSGSELLSINLSGTSNQLGGVSDAELNNGLRSTIMFGIERGRAATQEDPVALIFLTFEQHGQTAALTQYAALRKDGRLSAAQRIELAQAAGQQSLNDLRFMILQHANEDFPGNAEIEAALMTLKEQVK